MPIGINGSTGSHPDASRQAPIEGWGPTARWNRPIAIKVGYLSGGVDSTVGSSRCDGAAEFGLNAVRQRVKSFDGFIERLLDGVVVWLTLPATKRPSVVLQTEGNALAVQWARAQTSSMIAISALSPRRGTVRMMRV